MNNYMRGIIAGLVATIVLSVLMYMKGMMGVMPELDIISMLAGKMGGSAMMGWVAHFMIGALAYGLGFAIIGGKLPGGSSAVRGIVLGIIGWLMMMVVLMPMMGAGMFAMNMGMMAPVATLMLHVIFGAVLGLVYGKTGS
ncbi:MAG: hypothetical protein CVV18_04005 [Gammaproteobacteria bacterium HGW-Gammaproteobacteria-8]|nr:MAG: hypothetical protein CVV18_04005 [Gammaproteobacteria bacterium HGW-Gammaproteobacteria-8]